MDKGMIHVLGETKNVAAGFHHATQNGMQLKMYKFFNSGIIFFTSVINVFRQWLNVGN
jgi:hypothetical protein